MIEPSLLAIFVRPLAAAGIRYFITGGVAAIIYGEPRFTRDIDLVLAVRPDHSDRFLSLWPDKDYYSPSREAFETETARPQHGHFNIVHIETGLVADCYVAGDDPLHAWAFERVQTIEVDGARLCVAPVEYVISRKLAYFAQSGSTRHLEDIARIRRIQQDRIDQPSLDEWIRVLGLDEAWGRALGVDLDRV